MIITRRRFFAGSIALTAATAVIPKSLIPPLLPGPQRSEPTHKPAKERAGTEGGVWSMGLLGVDGKEINAPGYQRMGLRHESAETGGVIVWAEGVVFGPAMSTWPMVARCAVYMKGLERPMYIPPPGFSPIILAAGNTITVTGQDGVICMID